jgi:hypothetical protein
MNAQTKIEAPAPFKPRANLKKPVHCFAIRLDALLRVRPFISSDYGRYYLQGIFVHAHAEGGAVCVATDGHKLGVRRDPDGLVNEPQIVRIARELKAPGKMQHGAWAIMTRTGDRFAHLSLVERLHDPKHDTAENAIARADECYQRFGDVMIDGTFPDYTRVIPAEDKADTVRAFNGTYFKGFGTNLTIRGRDAGAPHIILDSADSEFLGVLMPMRSTTEHKQDWTKSLTYPGEAA